MSKQPHNPNRRILSAVTASLLLVGCTISPEPLEKMAVEKDVDSSLRYLQRMESPVTQPITLAEAIDRAIGHNLKRKVDALTIALSEKQLDASQLDLLPDLTARAGYAYRDSYAASGSVSVDPITKEPTSSDVNSYSVSQEPRNHTGSVAFSWNILDFGLSYIRANQQADRYLISKEKERKSIQQIQQEVRTAYYQVVAADSLLEKVKPIMSEAAKAYADSEKVAKAQLDSPMNHYNYQRELLEVEKNLQVIERNLLRSRTNLAELMGLKPGTSFRLSEKIMLNYTIPQVQLPMDTLEKVALLNRPELQEARYKERISNKEVKASLLKMLPGIELNSGYSYDSNMYLLSNQWQSLGSNVSWNLLDLFGAGAKREAAKTEVELA
ncbi:MAG: hypothetical protein RLZZ428_729, partial [Pseudomonadota bacterium]